MVPRPACRDTGGRRLSTQRGGRRPREDVTGQNHPHLSTFSDQYKSRLLNELLTLPEHASVRASVGVADLQTAQAENVIADSVAEALHALQSVGCHEVGRKARNIGMSAAAGPRTKAEELQGRVRASLGIK